MKNLLLLLVLSLGMIAHAQITYYELPSGDVMSFFEFEKHKKSLSDGDLVLYEVLDTRVSQDSIVKKVKFNRVESNPSGSHFDPFQVHRDKIGERFPIEYFLTSDSSGLDDVYVDGKPTMINFWFTRCMPCLLEIPMLNQLEREFSDEVNFIAITFDKQRLVDRFLARKDFNFSHITDVRKAIDDMGVQAFPMNVLLDKDGKIVQVYGDIMSDRYNISALLRDMINE